MRLTALKIGIGAMLTGSVFLGGCASTHGHSGAWAWTPPARLDAGAGMNPSAAVIRPRSGIYRVVPMNAHTPEYDRRDAALGVRTTNPYESWMNWPTEARPTLDRRRTYRTSRDAFSYSYPQTHRDDRYRRGYHRHGHYRRVR